MILYKLDSNKYYTGESIEVSDFDPIPFDCAQGLEPPILKDGEYIQWDSVRWVITNISPSDLIISKLEGEKAFIERSLQLKKQKDSEYWKSVRNKRDQLLSESDWTQLADVALPNLDAWKAYRQALRDVPSMFELPEDVVWPESPNQ